MVIHFTCKHNFIRYTIIPYFASNCKKIPSKEQNMDDFLLLSVCYGLDLQSFPKIPAPCAIYNPLWL